MYIKNEDAPLSFWFERLCSGSSAVISIIGCGGKTSLLWHLAQCWRHKKTLVSVTTKFRCPPPESRLYDWRYDQAALPRRARPGVSVACSRDAQSGKDKSLPLDELAALFPLFERTLLECDGSRMLPLKGWAAYEPVVPGGTALTCGVLPLWAIGRAADERVVHRLPLFAEQAGVQVGEEIRHEHIARLISGPNGLFREGRGKRLLFFNQIESAGAFEDALRVASLLPPPFAASLDGVIAGSARHGTARDLRL